MFQIAEVRWKIIIEIVAQRKFTFCPKPQTGWWPTEPALKRPSSVCSSFILHACACTRRLLANACMELLHGWVPAWLALFPVPSVVCPSRALNDHSRGISWRLLSFVTSMCLQVVCPFLRPQAIWTAPAFTLHYLLRSFVHNNATTSWQDAICMLVVDALLHPFPHPFVFLAPFVPPPPLFQPFVSTPTFRTIRVPNLCPHAALHHTASCTKAFSKFSFFFL